MEDGEEVRGQEDQTTVMEVAQRGPLEFSEQE